MAYVLKSQIYQQNTHIINLLLLLLVWGTYIHTVLTKNKNNITNAFNINIIAHITDIIDNYIIIACNTSNCLTNIQHVTNTDFQLNIGIGYSALIILQYVGNLSNAGQ